MNTQKIAAYGLFAALIAAVVYAQAITPLLVGLLGFVLSERLLAALNKRGVKAGRSWSIFLVTLFSIAFIGTTGFGLSFLINKELVQEVLMGFAETISESQVLLPPEIFASIPVTEGEIRSSIIVAPLKTHAASVASMGSSVLHSLILALVGWIVGAMIALSVRERSLASSGFLATWSHLWRSLSDAFGLIVLAQVMISAFNTLMTAIFLLIILRFEHEPVRIAA